MWRLTVDVERNSFADGGRDVVGGDAHVSGHHLASDPVKAQSLAVIRLDFFGCPALKAGSRRRRRSRGNKLMKQNRKWKKIPIHYCRPRLALIRFKLGLGWTRVVQWRINAANNTPAKSNDLTWLAIPSVSAEFPEFLEYPFDLPNWIHVCPLIL